jgi:hypothetical protein
MNVNCGRSDNKCCVAPVHFNFEAESCKGGSEGMEAVLLSRFETLSDFGQQETALTADGHRG